MKHWIVSIMVLLILLSACSSTGNSISTTSSEKGTFMVDNKGCKVYNPYPKAGETISWSGQCVNGYASGYGTALWYVDSQFKAKYVGSYLNGKQHGRGSYSWVNGDKYEGVYINNEEHGYGIFTGVNGNNYKGNFVNGKRKNSANQKIKNNCIFNSQNSNFKDSSTVWNGSCSDGYLSGQGTLKFYTKNGKYNGKYIGHMKNGMMNDSHAELIPPDKNGDQVIYIGGFKNNQMQGEGEYWKPMGKYRGLLFKVKHNNGKMVYQKYVGKKGIRELTHQGNKGTTGFSGAESAAIISAAVIGGAKLFSKSNTSSSNYNSSNSSASGYTERSKTKSYDTGKYTYFLTCNKKMLSPNFSVSWSKYTGQWHYRIITASTTGYNSAHQAAIARCD